MTTVLIKVMADYGCSPLWLSNDDGGRNLELDELGLSADLVAGLQAWADTYDATLDPDDPASAGFASEADDRLFVDEGEELARRLLRELGDDDAVLYFDNLSADVREVRRES